MGPAGSGSEQCGAPAGDASREGANLMPQPGSACRGPSASTPPAARLGAINDMGQLMLRAQCLNDYEVHRGSDVNALATPTNSSTHAMAWLPMVELPIHH
jgi:hypothetical protein